MLSPSTRAAESEPTKPAPSTNACARPFGCSCTVYSIDTPNCEPSPSSRWNCSASCGVVMTRMSRMPARISALALGKAPIYEPGLDDLLGEVVASGRLTVSADPAAVAGSRLHFVCVGTPQSSESGAADLRYVD